MTLRLPGCDWVKRIVELEGLSFLLSLAMERKVGKLFKSNTELHKLFFQVVLWRILFFFHLLIVMKYRLSFPSSVIIVRFWWRDYYHLSEHAGIFFPESFYPLEPPGLVHFDAKYIFNLIDLVRFATFWNDFYLYFIGRRIFPILCLCHMSKNEHFPHSQC